MRDRLQDLGEFGLIDRLAAIAGGEDAAVALGIGDDCAAVRDPAGGDELLLLTTDLLAEDVHFLPDADPVDLGDKLLAVSLSDIAAMGGRPGYAVVSVAIPAGVEPARIEAIYRGLRRRADRHGVRLVGGDTTGSHGGLVLSLALTGRVAEERMWTRAGASVGDRVLVSGTLGDAAAGLALEQGTEAGLAPEDDAFLRARHLRPEPRVDLARALSDAGGVTAAIDLSDGLASDLGHVCHRSGVGALIELPRLPISPALRRFGEATGADPVALATGGGEDFELCLAAAPDAAERLVAAGEGSGVPLTEVGRVVEAGAPPIRWVDEVGADVAIDPGWDHFR